MIEIADHFDKFLNQLEGVLDSEAFPAETTDWLLKCIKSTVPGGKLTRGQTFLYTTSQFKQLDEVDYIYGWLIELLQSFFLIADDIMDDSALRRGKPCWHINLGVHAINDVLLLQTLLFRTIDSITLPQFSLEVQRLFQQVTFRTEAGQQLDLATLPPKTPIDISKYTKERWEQIATLKTAYYSFYLPVALALILNNRKDLICEVEKYFIPLGVYFQAQDDFLDVFGDEKIIGKVGTDIAEGKCSWLVVKALEFRNTSEIIERYYGKGDEVSIREIKNLFKQVNIERRFEEYSEEFSVKYKTYRGDEKLGRVFDFLFCKIYNRSK